MSCIHFKIIYIFKIAFLFLGEQGEFKKHFDLKSFT